MNLFQMNPSDQVKLLEELLVKADSPEAKMLVESLREALAKDPAGSQESTQRLAALLGLTASSPQTAQPPPLPPQQQERPGTDLDAERMKMLEQLDKGQKAEGEPVAGKEVALQS